MATGQMRYGASQDSGSDRTVLKANIAGQTAFEVQNSAGSGAAIHGQGYTGVFGYTESDSGSGVFGGSSTSIGVFGITSQVSNTQAVIAGVAGVGGASPGATCGVRGHSSVDSTSSQSVGVHGTGGGPNSNGVIGQADNGTSAYGVWGKSTSGYAGVFHGKVSVYGNLWKSTGGFRIDHPVDPENKYLSHSFVESPDMLNVYCGSTETDDAGEATVLLPEYFAELNQGITYQLTVIGTFAQAIVAEEVKDNRFMIRTDRPAVKVCWLVTGVRKDPFAERNRIVAEEDKPEEHRGRYLHPDVYGKPRSLFVDFERERGLDAAPPEQPPGLPYAMWPQRDSAD